MPPNAANATTIRLASEPAKATRRPSAGRRRESAEMLPLSCRTNSSRGSGRWRRSSSSTQPVPLRLNLRLMSNPPIRCLYPYYRWEGSDPYGALQADRDGLGLGLLERAPKPSERPVEGDLDRIRPQAQLLADLPRGQVGAVPERDQLLVAGVEPLDRVPERQPPDGFFLEVAGRRLRGRLRHRLGGWRDGIDDAPAGDSDQPRDRLALPMVVAVAIAQRSLEHIARDVLSIRAVTDPVGDVRIDPADERFRISERIARPHPTLPCAA